MRNLVAHSIQLILVFSLFEEPTVIPSTPHKTRRASKHPLTPESKVTAESKPKRHAKGKEIRNRTYN